MSESDRGQEREKRREVNSRFEQDPEGLVG